MKRPYLTRVQRQMIYWDTFSGSLYLLDLAWKIFLRELSRPILKFINENRICGHQPTDKLETSNPPNGK